MLDMLEVTSGEGEAIVPRNTGNKVSYTRAKRRDLLHENVEK